MGFKLKTLPALLSILIVGKISALAQTADPNPSALTIFVYNQARVTHSELDAAEQQASLIFQASGVAVEWVNCLDRPEACRHLFPNDFVTHIVAKGPTASDAVFGVSFLAEDGSGKYSDVFFDRIETAHRVSGISAACLLGAVTAHELGHLLLGSHAHSPLGIMSPHWGSEDLRRISRGLLRFTPDQSYRMKARSQNWHTHTPTLQVARTHPIN